VLENKVICKINKAVRTAVFRMWWQAWAPFIFRVEYEGSMFHCNSNHCRHCYKYLKIHTNLEKFNCVECNELNISTTFYGFGTERQLHTVFVGKGFGNID
jgi:hypothetical protein